MSSQVTYQSTRGGSSNFSFEDAVLKGLANDGGLFIPSEIPKLPEGWKEKWSSLSFPELAYEIMSLYIPRSEISAEELKDLAARSYATFRHPETTPLKKLNNGINVLELFHGPTFAFKDVALQFLGNLFEFFLTRKNGDKPEEERDHLTVVGATSGDTGSAAIYGLRGKKDVSVFILFPEGRVSPVQEAQMTTVTDPNVHCVTVAGVFDDCQDLVKQVFGDAEFNRKHHVGAVNSINWARILAQITYYFYAYLSLYKQNKDVKVRFVVPTGNFGDILAGYYAKEMGLPTEKLVIATNENDILDRFFHTGRYEKADTSKGPVTGPVCAKETYSPAMDILVSSNFERYLWYLARQQVAPNHTDSEACEILAKWMNEFKTNGSVAVRPEVLDAARKDFVSERVDNETTIATIKKVYETDKYVLDPHTAVGVEATTRRMKEAGAEGTTFVSLSTAHPAKFDAAVNLALSSFEGYNFETQVMPREFHGLKDAERRVIFSGAPRIEVIKQIVEINLEREKKMTV
ncbi:threonine synthase [Schizosaccharomyces japonicus yFS275]|uniref:Threonine synthase n=1 Tax=Schizosaccharomyces japonicus (strain yFS275 / FY16936) TaxID=402676 RepID=B6JVL7_SCHJY|nr:threonine synthase [Schizosaccharomyces japonicus yFS275]EEB05418.1 threonine synthase [Schizosaccharomyces japonicus yFS275]